MLDERYVPKAHFWGYSMGGWIGFGLAKYIPERCSSLIIGGQAPYARSFELDAIWDNAEDEVYAQLLKE